MDASLSTFPHLLSLSELESRMQLIMRVQENQSGETFSQLAEWFYKRRPLLLSLCQDLYDAYATLLNRLNHSKLQTSKPIISHEMDSGTDISSEVESIMSFQPMQATCDDKQNMDRLVSQLVTANLEKDIAQDEVRRRETKYREASKKVELLKKLVMLLDMEKEVAVEETANLAHKLTTLLEDNRELATEALFMKKEAVRLARCMLRMRDDHFHKVCLLQNQIYALEASREPDYEKVSSLSCFGLDNSKKESKKRKRRSEPGEKKRSKWLKKLNPFT